ncbi:MAG: filamentous hemagglutinin N-terminal domain-containing protein, partial [Rivularia sp. ALOHA_DT_140]|nr:filamentous hemagglutinin N-terminal domain-containing protein [Rivularia sp. ALOHA_DT_140]
LFHSFTQFDIPNGSEAHFNNATDIQNILTRVTGDSISNIDGLIKANGSANLYLVNPNGIVFSENASLDIGGSFITTTADSILFGDGFEFSAVNPQDKPLLTVNVPLGLQYGTNQNGGITNFGDLKVKNGKNITLIGSSLENQADLTASSGQISFVAVSNQSFARLGEFGELLSLESQSINVDDANTSNIGTVTNQGEIKGVGTKITLLGDKIDLLTNSSIFVSGSDGGGEVQLGNSDTSTIKVKGAVLNITSGTNNGGDINFESESFSLQGVAILNNTTSNADAGNIKIKANSASIINGFIGSETEGGGKSGSIKFETDILDIKNASVQSITTGNGNAGNIDINASSFTLQNGGLSTQTAGKGNSGNITFNEIDTISLINAALTSDSNGQGNAGQIDITTNSLILKNQGVIASNSGKKNPDFNSTANSGNINIKANSVLLENNSNIASDIFVRGKSGDINIETNSMVLKNASAIVNNAREDATGNAGNIEIKAHSILFENESEFIDNSNKIILNSIGAITQSKGNAGEITINSEEFLIRNQGGITITTQNEGDAGRITLNTSLLQLENYRVENEPEITNSDISGKTGISSASSGSGKAGEL